MSHLEIILLIHFPQVLQNSSTSALNLSVSDWDILKRQSFLQIIHTSICFFHLKSKCSINHSKTNMLTFVTNSYIIWNLTQNISYRLLPTNSILKYSYISFVQCIITLLSTNVSPCSEEPQKNYWWIFKEFLHLRGVYIILSSAAYRVWKLCGKDSW